MTDKNLEGAFTPPPADAPQQVTAPGSERATAEQVAAARAHERELEPFTPKPLSREAMRAILGKDPEQVQLGDPPKKPSMADQIRSAAASVAKQTAKVVTSSFKGPDVPIVKAPRGPMVQVDVNPLTSPLTPSTNIILTDVQEPNFVLPPPLPHQPAASNTDSPSRGIPTPIADEGKKITGGFGVPGDGADAQYFPLDGTELRAVALTLMDDLARRIEDDLRFSIACTYPRAHVRVVIEVDAYGMEKTMEIPKVAPPHNATPLEVAKRYGDQIVFVVVAERQEMTSDGQSVTPPNRMRQEAGLDIPHKHAVDTPTGRQFVDVKS
jgi:hypothetical protein